MKLSKWACSVTAISCSLLTKRHPLKRFLYAKELSSNATTSWSESWFQNVDQPTPVFRLQGENIKVLTDPETFYEELLSRSSKATKRITLASLYLGNGEKEEKLVQTIHENLKNSKVPIDVNILLEGTRGSRGVKNSRTLLLPLVKDFTNTTHVALFHSPILRGLKRLLIPERFNETINVTHLKVYLFDNTLILSGANLSHDYFTNRQDRYIIFDQSQELCDYFDELVQAISKFSFWLQPDDTLKLHPSFSVHPYKDPQRKFNEAAAKVILEFTNRYRGSILDRNLNLQNAHDNVESSKTDTLIFPMLQMRSLGITHEETIVKNIVSCAPSKTDLLLATAYFNVTDDYWNVLLATKCDVDIVMAHPKAMGFYKAKGMAGGIPNAFSLFSKRRFDDLVGLKLTEKIKFLEFHRDSWTFHGKGLWADVSEIDSLEVMDPLLYKHPFLTIIGSTNFSKRSVVRDMEAEVCLVTGNKNLISQLKNERDSLRNDTTLVNETTFNEEERNAEWWVYLIATYMSDYF